METVPAFEGRTRLAELLSRVVGGEEIIITRSERPAARHVPQGASSLEGIRRAGEGLEAVQQEIAGFCAGKPTMSRKGFRFFRRRGPQMSRPSVAGSSVFPYRHPMPLASSGLGAL
jgi:antitoxin (DNA-binding transcriptional repressor) of toxin-antitoxin stability system